MKSIFFSILYFTLIFPARAEIQNEHSSIKIFNPDDYSSIVSQFNRPSMIMVFWSIECVPCLKEMRTISNMSKAEKQNFVFIATDGHDHKNDIKHLLKQVNLLQENNWVFNSDEIDMIISTVDSQWYGETPKIYLFDADKNRTTLNPR